MNDLYSIDPKYTEAEIEKFDKEDLFMDAYVELLKHSIQMLYHVVDFKYCDDEGNPKKINKDDAVLGGNLTRLIKLNTSFLQNICEGKLEICHIINRCIAETSVNIKFILIESEERVKRNYIKHSLITEKELWEIILNSIRIRGGDVLPIEQRMQKSIQNSFDNSDFDLEEVKRSSKWKSIKSRADEVAGELFYSVFYGIASHSIHGNWQEILFNNLTKFEEGFKLNLQWQRPRPQIIDGPIMMNLDIVNLFSDKELKDHEHFEILKEKSALLMTYLTSLTNKHEQWLSSLSS
jgi:hypothetical protein